MRSARVPLGPRPSLHPLRHRLLRLCSRASSLLWRSQTSRVRSSSATAPHLSDAGQPRIAAGQTRDLPVPVQGTCVHARFYDHAGSPRALALTHSDVLPSATHTASAPETIFSIAAQWLACTYPYPSTIGFKPARQVLHVAAVCRHSGAAGCRIDVLQLDAVMRIERVRFAEAIALVRSVWVRRW